MEHDSSPFVIFQLSFRNADGMDSTLEERILKAGSDSLVIRRRAGGFFRRCLAEMAAAFI
jgi:hypothetical protein